MPFCGDRAATGAVRRARRYVVVLTMAFVVGASPVHLYGASTFYVGLGGTDDTALGRGASPENPWRTIGFAVQYVPDADATVLVLDGVYLNPEIYLGRVFATRLTIRARTPYRAILMNTGGKPIFRSFGGANYTIEGFVIGPTHSVLAVQIADGARGFVFRNNIFRDSFDNDLLKINDRASDVLVEGNVFYNRGENDEDIDINAARRVTVQDNIFFSDYAGSGRPIPAEAVEGSDIVVKNSPCQWDPSFCNAWSIDVTIRRNIFLNWEGPPVSNFIRLGEDGTAGFEAQDVLIENNLLLGNSTVPMDAPIGVQAARHVRIRGNTIVGNLPSRAYVMRLDAGAYRTEGVEIDNNIWADPTGTMENFVIGEAAGVSLVRLERNLYWNGGNPIPPSGQGGLPGGVLEVTDDPSALFENPRLPVISGTVLPRFDTTLFAFQSGQTTVRGEFERLVRRHAIPARTSPLIDAAAGSFAPVDDILGVARAGRGVGPDLGAFEAQLGASTDAACAPAEVLCVDDDPGPMQEYGVLQEAVSLAQAGDTVLVHDGSYDGFEAARGGAPGSPITVRARGTGAVIDRPSAALDRIRIRATDYVIIDGLRVRDAIRAGISVLEARGVVVRNAVVGPNGRWGIFTGYAPQVQILHNAAFNSATEHGIYVSNSPGAGDQPVIRGNESYGNYENGIQLNGDCHAGGDGTIDGALIEDNVVHDNGVKGVSLISMRDSVVQNNVIYENGRRGSGAGGIHLTDEPGCGLPSAANLIVNNTLVEPRITGIRLSDGAANNTLFNNLVVGPRTIIDEAGGGVNQISPSSNMMRGTVDGLFVNPAAGDYHLLPASLAADAGEPVYAGRSAPPVDFEGTARPQGRAHDAGADETDGSVPADTTPPVTTAAPPGGTYVGPLTVTLSANEPATIVYTTDGTPPTAAAPRYTAPIPLSADTTLQFFGTDASGNVEAVRVVRYVLQPAPPLALTLEAEAMPVKTTGGAVSGGWDIWSNGYVAAPVSFPASGEYELTIVARGDFAGGAWPRLEVRIDQRVLGAVTVDTSSWRTVTVRGTVTAGSHEVALAFTNDYYSPPADRNLYVDQVTIRGPAL